MSGANDMAFPVLDRTQTPNDTTQLGLTKRELFAAMAMQGLCASPHPRVSFAPVDCSRGIARGGRDAVSTGTGAVVMSAQHTPGPWSIEPTNTAFAIRAPRHHENTTMAELDHIPITVARVEEFGRAFAVEGEANARLIHAAPDMHAVLDELEDSFDTQIHPEQAKEDFDAPDDREYTVNITAKQWRALRRALSKAKQS